MDTLFGALGRGVVRFRWLVVVVWLVGTVAAVHSLPSLSSQVNNDNSAFLPASAPSNQAALLAQPLIGSTDQAQVQVVAVTRDGRTLGAADEAALAHLKDTLAEVPTVEHVTFLGASPDGQAVQLLVVSSVSPFNQSGSTTLVTDLENGVAKADVSGAFDVHLAGSVATNAANQAQSKKTGNQIQILSILFIIILLLLIFRSALAPLVTLLPAVLVLQLAGSIIGELGSRRAEDVRRDPAAPHRADPRGGHRLRPVLGVPGARGDAARTRQPRRGGRGRAPGRRVHRRRRRPRSSWPS